MLIFEGFVSTTRISPYFCVCGTLLAKKILLLKKFFFGFLILQVLHTCRSRVSKTVKYHICLVILQII